MALSVSRQLEMLNNDLILLGGSTEEEKAKIQNISAALSDLCAALRPYDTMGEKDGACLLLDDEAQDKINNAIDNFAFFYGSEAQTDAADPAAAERREVLDRIAGLVEKNTRVLGGDNDVSGRYLPRLTEADERGNAPRDLSDFRREFADDRAILASLGAEMKKVNTGMFKSSDAFNAVITSFGEVQAANETAAVTPDRENAQKLLGSYGTLAKKLDAYLLKKANEEQELRARGKEPSEVAYRRVAYAEKLRDYVRARREELTGAMPEVERADDFAKGKGLDFMTSVYKPAPIFNPAGAAKNAYTREGFDMLKTYDISRLSVGGRSVSDMEFAAVAMSAVTQPGFGGEARKKEVGERMLSPAGRAISSATMFTADAAGMSAGRLDPRDNVFRVEHIREGVQPAREAAYQAFGAYHYGDPAPLGRLIADGLCTFRNWTLTMNVSTTNQYAMTTAFSKLLDLMESDPRLKDEVSKRFAGRAAEGREQQAQLEGQVAAAEGEFLSCAPNHPDYVTKCGAYHRLRSDLDIAQTMAGSDMNESVRILRGYMKAEQIGLECDEAVRTLRQAAERGERLSPERKRECLHKIFAESCLNTATELQNVEESKGDARFFEEPAIAMTFANPATMGVMGPEGNVHMLVTHKPSALVCRLGDREGMRDLETYIDHSVSADRMREMMAADEGELAARFGSVIVRKNYMMKLKTDLARGNAREAQKDKAARVPARGNERARGAAEEPGVPAKEKPSLKP